MPIYVWLLISALVIATVAIVAILGRLAANRAPDHGRIADHEAPVQPE